MSPEWQASGPLCPRMNRFRVWFSFNKTLVSLVSLILAVEHQMALCVPFLCCRWTCPGCWRGAPEGWSAAPSHPCTAGPSGGQGSSTGRWTPISSPGTLLSAATPPSPLVATEGNKVLGNSRKSSRSPHTNTHTPTHPPTDCEMFILCPSDAECPLETSKEGYVKRRATTH